MRLRVRLDNPHGATIPISHQEYLTAAVYGLLHASDADYARFLHDEGYAGEDGKAFKLFTFSGLRAARRAAQGEWLRLPPGPVEWFVSSPLEPFLTHFAMGLLGTGLLQVAAARFPVLEVQTLPPPALDERTQFSCLTPVVCALPLPDGGTRYLRPAEGTEFSEAVRRNLLRKHLRVYGHPPADGRFALTFDAAYLAGDRNSGTKLTAFKNTKIVGALCPFAATGSTELMRLMLDCGAGEKNSSGFGMVEVMRNTVEVARNVL